MSRHNKRQSNETNRNNNEEETEEDIIRSSKRIRRNILSTSESEPEEQNSITSEINVSDITWTSEPAQPKILKFSRQHSGIQLTINFSAPILDYFKLFFSEKFVNFIVGTTNSYQHRVENNNTLRDSRGTSLAEMYCFLAIKLLMSRNKKLSHYEYWSHDELLRSNIFGQIMSRDRFLYLLKMLHFNTNDMNVDSDRIYKIREICDMLRQSFRDTFYPFQDLCIDESLLLYKGRLSFKQ